MRLVHDLLQLRAGADDLVSLAELGAVVLIFAVQASDLRLEPVILTQHRQHPVEFFQAELQPVFNVEVLLYIVRSPHPEGAHGRIHTAFACKNDGGQVLRHRSNLAQDFQAIRLPRPEVQVEDDHLDRGDVPGYVRKGLGPGGEALHLPSFSTKAGGEHVTHFHLVVGDHNVGLHRLLDELLGQRLVQPVQRNRL